MNLPAWQEYFSLGRASRQGAMEVRFDPETLGLRVDVEGPLPDPVAVDAFHGDSPYAGVGPNPSDLKRPPDGG